MAQNRVKISNQVEKSPDVTYFIGTNSPSFEAEWKPLNAWIYDGNTVGVERYIGTNDSFDFPVQVGNVETWRFKLDGSITRYGQLYSCIPNGADGLHNVSWGETALLGITIGTNNTCIGDLAGFQISSGNDNVLIGYAAGGNITGGQYGTFVGSQAGISLTSGDGNTFVGYSAGGSIVTGAGNTFIGDRAGNTTTGGYGNICIGADATVNPTGSYSIYIGYLQETTDDDLPDHSCVIGSFKGGGGTTGYITDFYLGQGYHSTLDADLVTVNIHASGVRTVGINESAALSVFNICGARGRGTGRGGDVGVQTAPPGASGSAENALSDVIVFRAGADQNVDCVNTNGALVLPRLTTTQRNALTAINGMIIYNSTTDKFQGREAGAWVDLI